MAEVGRLRFEGVQRHRAEAVDLPERFVQDVEAVDQAAALDSKKVYSSVAIFPFTEFFRQVEQQGVPRFMRATAAASIRPAVPAVRVACRLVPEDHVGRSAPAGRPAAAVQAHHAGGPGTPAARASAALTNGSLATTVKPSGSASPARVRPMLPKPTMPSTVPSMSRVMSW